jgi:D-psicose/D-tagatose/L-ribulose 3-epimerase
MSKLGVHALVWVGGWSHKECESAISKSAELGFDYIEIPALDPSSIDTKYTLAQLEKYGIGATVSLGLPLNCDISSEDPEIVARGEVLLNDALRLTGEIGATHMCGILYSGFAKYMQPKTERGVQNSAEVLFRIAEKAKLENIAIGLEVVNRYETNLLNTGAEGVEMVKRIGSDNVYVHLDTYHMHIEESGLSNAIRACGDHLGYFHVGESHRGYLGSGNIDFQDTFRALAEISYSGPITFESFSSSVVSADLSNILGIWRNLWEDSEDLAQHAKTFIEEQIKAGSETHRDNRSKA